ncbi:hypothetical protein HOC13_03250 [Candidatus Woesearchaeota archaeon]|jgi:hypothetical protein|nr:hypothetical protein [Candidatus Woesearchaeota archaeon]
MPRLEIKKDDQVLVVAERPEDISVEKIEDFELKTSQIEEPVKLEGTTLVLKGQFSEIKLFPGDLEKIKEYL